MMLWRVKISARNLHPGNSGYSFRPNIINYCAHTEWCAI